jgi:hypothetical protein
MKKAYPYQSRPSAPGQEVRLSTILGDVYEVYDTCLFFFWLMALLVAKTENNDRLLTMHRSICSGRR